MVERWSDNRLDSATVDQIPLGDEIYFAKLKTGSDQIVYHKFFLGINRNFCYIFCGGELYLLNQKVIHLKFI